ncbi:MAG: prolyl oligopeptidase family serine peptidase [Bacteroidia bacterium]
MKVFFRYTMIVFSSLLLVQCGSNKSWQIKKDLLHYNIEWGDRERSFYLYVPKRIKKSPPVLFCLHGGGGNGPNTASLTNGKFNEIAEREGFIVVYPEGIEKQWNDGRKGDQVTSWKENIDDVGFLSEVVDWLDSAYSIDRNEVFTSGMSNGGFMSNRLICDRSDLFKGAAVITASMSLDYLPKCNPSNSVSLIVINGTDDPLVPYNGGSIKVLGKERGNVMSTSDYMDFWKSKNQCSVQHEAQKLEDKADDGTEISVTRYSDCANSSQLILYTVEGGGHTWPGGKQYLGERLIGKTSQEFNACELIWDFFAL